MEEYRYILEDRFGEFPAQPLGIKEFQIEYSPEDDDAINDYTKKANGKLVIKGEAYQRLLRIEKSIYRCTLQTIRIERRCPELGAASYVLVFKGDISLNDANWNLSRCYCEIKFSEDNSYKCLLNNKGEKVDVFAFGNPKKYEVRLYPTNIKIETVVCTSNQFDRGCGWCGSGSSAEAGFYSIKDSLFRYGRPGTVDEFHCSVTYVREVLELPCNEVPSDEWTAVSSCYDNKIKYARFPNFVNCKYTEYTDDVAGYYEMRQECETMVSKNSILIKNGIHLKDVLKRLVTDQCGMTVKSDFFQINPENVSSINYVTGKLSTTKDILMFQKSDVKRPSAQNQASKFELTFEKTIEALNIFFNVEWRIIDNVFILEHTSFWNKQEGLDLTQSKYDKYTVGKEAYSYKSEDIPSEEDWFIKEVSSYGDFKGTPILYKSGCESTGKNNKKKYTVDEFTTDVEFCMSNPDPDSDKVSDVGGVFVSVSFDGSSYFMNSERPILSSQSSVNNVLSIAHLQDKYHRHNRPLLIGTMNNKETVFKSTIPTKKGERISIPLPCNYTFSPDDTIKTMLGTGVIEKALFNTRTAHLELDLLYQANEDLEENKPPKAPNLTRTTYIDKPIVIDLLEGATDEDGNETIRGFDITQHPTKGSLTILDERSVLFTPGTTGDDRFLYRVFDEWHEYSNIALCSITIRPKNQPPVANDNNYIAYNSEPLIVSASNGIFSNDSDDFGFELLEYDSITNKGGSVVVQNDGSFVYNAPSDFVGEDKFNYTIIDDQGLTDSATVYFDVRDKTQVIANPDVYITYKDEVLICTGPEPNRTLTSNDVSPSGGSLSTISETKQSDKGGTVQINNDGTFTYTPSVGFVGKDTFKYTVTNGLTNAEGLVTVNVVENLFVRLIQENSKYKDVVRECNGHQTLVGGMSTADLVLQFFKDNNATIPYDVTGLGLNCLISFTTWDEGNSYTYENYTSGLSGTSQIIEQGAVLNHQERSCSSMDEWIINMSRDVFLQDGQGYKKI